MDLPYDFAFITDRGAGDWYRAALCGERYHIRDYCQSFEESEKSRKYGVWRIKNVAANVDCGEWLMTEIYIDAGEPELNCNLEDVL